VKGFSDQLWMVAIAAFLGVRSAADFGESAVFAICGVLFLLSISIKLRGWLARRSTFADMTEVRADV